jgi:hypothetical protein
MSELDRYGHKALEGATHKVRRNDDFYFARVVDDHYIEIQGGGGNWIRYGKKMLTGVGYKVEPIKTLEQLMEEYLRE